MRSHVNKVRILETEKRGRYEGRKGGRRGEGERRGDIK